MTRAAGIGARTTGSGPGQVERRWRTHSTRQHHAIVTEAGQPRDPVKELCRKHGFSEASYYLWRNKFGGMDVPDAKRLKALEAENARLKKLLAESMLENEVTREALRKKW